MEFLYYVAEHPVIYRSQYFVKFFEDTSLKIESPVVEHDATIEKTLTNESLEESSINSMENEQVVVVKEVNDGNGEIYIGNLDTDYLYDAALSFSQAVQAEANLKYKNSFDLYKLGIDKLLTGAKNDNNEKRKRIAKTKASKYLEKAEQLYENHILQQQENEFIIENSDCDEAQNISALERPFNNMCHFKVIHINDRIMKVQDRTDKKIFVIKVIWKSHTHKVLFMPQKIPFMIPLLNYYHSENVIFLLLPYISGGLLWNYINTYVPTESQHKIEELFVEPPQENKLNDLEKTKKSDAQDYDVDDKLLFTNEIIIESDEKDEVGIDVLSEQEEFDNAVPSFDTLTTEIDVHDLMACSKNLLKSVTKTLEKSVILSSEICDQEIDNNHNNYFDEKNEKVETEEEEKEASCKQLSEVLIDKCEFKNVPEIVLRRWACEIIICVNALHKNGIVLGDLNLDNILLGSNGHIAITYFHQKHRSSYQNLCYLNPNAIRCMYVSFDFPLNKSSDYYSVGVILYEIFTRNRFYIQHNGGISKYNEIQYPDLCELSEEAKDLVHKLILSKSDKRLAYDNLKAHAFFAGIDFNEIEKCANE